MDESKINEIDTATEERMIPAPEMGEGAFYYRGALHQKFSNELWYKTLCEAKERGNAELYDLETGELLDFDIVLERQRRLCASK